MTIKCNSASCFNLPWTKFLSRYTCGLWVKSLSINIHKGYKFYLSAQIPPALLLIQISCYLLFCLFPINVSTLSIYVFLIGVVSIGLSEAIRTAAWTHLTCWSDWGCYLVIQISHTLLSYWRWSPYRSRRCSPVTEKISTVQYSTVQYKSCRSDETWPNKSQP